jgi:CBS domain-containing protein
VDDLGGLFGAQDLVELRLTNQDRSRPSRHSADGVKAESCARSSDETAPSAAIVAEGVRPRECTELLDIGIDYLQGYFFRQAASRAGVREAAIAHLAGRESIAAAANADELIIDVPPVGPATRVQDVVAMFREHLDWDSLAVVRDERPLGIVRRDDLLLFLTKPLHPEVYNRKPVTSVMESPPLLIDSRLLDQVARLVTRRTRSKVNDDFIVTREGRYAGLGKIIDVLRQITAQQIHAAKDCNPLTLLPGNVQIDARVERLLSQRRDFVVCHLDVDDFKPYNDRTVMQGDQFCAAGAAIQDAACHRTVSSARRWRDRHGHAEPDWKGGSRLVRNFTAAVPPVFGRASRSRRHPCRGSRRRAAHVPARHALDRGARGEGGTLRQSGRNHRAAATRQGFRQGAPRHELPPERRRPDHRSRHRPDHRTCPPRWRAPPEHATAYGVLPLTTGTCHTA